MDTTRIGHALAKILGIQLRYRNEVDRSEEIRRGESIFSVQTADTFVEDEPGSLDWIAQTVPSRHDLVQYVRSLFPFLSWIGSYNIQWLSGDLVAGITIGAVVVPQGMAYAILADLPPQFGLYSSFMGVLIYWFFATSKDITIGPVAVMSTLVGQILKRAAKDHPDVPGHVIASALAVIAGCIIIFIGLVRCGWIVDLISLTAISAFMTGSALNIAVGQLPALLGIKGFDTRASTYRVFIHTLQGLGRTSLDAAIGLTALLLLYLMRSVCQYGARRYPKRQKAFFFTATLRTVFVILLYTMVSWLVNRNRRSNPCFKILSTVPRGLKSAAVPRINTSIIKIFAKDLPATVIVLLIEHIAIAKSFGRVNNYVINPSQELVAIGITNILGPFLGAYPATGSFSRTAIKSKAGVRTPFAGVITAAVVLLAIYALTAVFFYIPMASLAAVIIHAVGDLITPPNTVYQFWRVSPLEVPIFFAGVLVTVFSSIENGIYTTISVSFALLLFRILKARGRFLGPVQVHSVLGDRLLMPSLASPHSPSTTPADLVTFKDVEIDVGSRAIFVPLDHGDGSNPSIDVHTPYPGIFIYRFSEGFNYPNANHYLDHLTSTIFSSTRRTNPHTYARPGDRPWNDPGPSIRDRKNARPLSQLHLPTLKAIVLDFSSINNVDITSVQQLIDVRNQLDRYASPTRVDWHFASITNRWTKRALAAAEFGYPSAGVVEGGGWKPIFSIAKMTVADPNVAEAEKVDAAIGAKGGVADVEDLGDIESGASGGGSDKPNRLNEVEYLRPSDRLERTAVVNGLNRPLFHVDLTSALQSAVANVQAREDACVVQGEDEERAEVLA